MQCNYTVVFLVKVKMLLSAVKFGNFGLVGTIEKKKKIKGKDWTSRMFDNLWEPLALVGDECPRLLCSLFKA